MKANSPFFPSYYGEFHCLAGHCEDSCCSAGWEIPLDDESYGLYKALNIPDIDGSLEKGEDGDRIFKTVLRDGKRRCVYLEDSGLCRLYALSGGRLGEVCSRYPRFLEEYDGFAEAGLSVSCPEAQRLILLAKRSSYSALGESPGEELLAFIHPAREHCFDIAFSRPGDEAAGIIYYNGIYLQDELMRGSKEYSLPTGERSLFGRIASLYIGFSSYLIESTDILLDSWREGLIRASSGELGDENALSDKEKRALLGYLVYRYFLKAVNYSDISAVCGFIAQSYHLLTRMPGDAYENMRLFSKELEHNRENLDAAVGYFL